MSPGENQVTCKEIALFPLDDKAYLCPIGCQVKGLYSNKRNLRGSIFDFNSKERDRAQSFDDKLFMKLLGRNYDDMA